MATRSASHSQSERRKLNRINEGHRQRHEEAEAWPGQPLKRSELMLPMLAAMRELGAASPKAIAERTAQLLGLDAEVLRAKRVYNGRQSGVFEHNVRWAQQTAKQRGWAEAANRGSWRLTPGGQEAVGRIRPVVYFEVFRTSLGRACVALAEQAAALVEPGSVQSCIVSPPFPLNSGPPYGTTEPAQWIPWMLDVLAAWVPAVADDGCIAIHLGMARYRGISATSSYRERFLLAAIDDLNLWRQQDLAWLNPTRLADLQWGARQGIAPRASFDPIYILSKAPTPKLSIHEWRDAQPARAATGAPGGLRASGKTYGAAAAGTIGKPIPSNVITAAQPTNDNWRRSLRGAGLEPHPCPMPAAVIDAVLMHTTEPGDLVADFFFGSGSTGASAERLGRRWIGFDRDETYLRSAAHRPEFVGSSGFEVTP